MSRNRLLLGATGLIGQTVLQQCQDAKEELRVLSRRRPEGMSSATEWVQADDLASAPDSVFAVIDTVICALGTTQKTAGSKEAFAAIDRDLVLTLARRAQAAGVTHWLQVSALGADARSSIFYNRIKGETDDALRAMGFARVDILTPSLLLGDRDEHRPGEALSQKLMPLLNPLLRGGLRKYRPTPAALLAQTLRQLSAETTPGCYTHALEP